MQPSIVLAHVAGHPLFSADDLDRLGEVGTLLDRRPIESWDDPRADALLGAAQVLVGHWGCPELTAEVLDRAPDLQLFAYAAGTVKGIVTAAVFERGIRVTSGAPANAEPVAEFTLAAILFAGKNVLWRRDALRDPSIRDRRPRGEVRTGNWDKTIGIVGASLVGRRVIELLAPFPHLRVALYDPYVSEPEAVALGVTKLELDELCGVVDVLSIHAPDLPSTRHLIGAAQLARLRSGSTLINTARGALLDHDALLDELDRARLFAVLDVTDPEPLPDDSPLRFHPNVFLTPHLAGSQGTELARLAEHVTDEVRRWSAGRPARHEVTRRDLEISA